jgi:integrating conjugative element protein (TIGR03749 family)
MSKIATKKITQISSFIILFATMFIGIALADITPQEHVVWDKAPINVVLPVGQERMITFPDLIQFGYDKDSLPPNILGVQNNNGTLYLTAHKAFQPQRIDVRRIKTGHIILLNISAQQGADNTPLNVVMAQDQIQNTAQGNQEMQGVNPIALMRFAEQQLYAPKRLLVIPGNIFVTPMHTTKTVQLILDGRVVATPQRSWRSGIYFVTAVTLHNMSNDLISLDQKRMCGNWRMSAFFPTSVLTSRGSFRDTTTAFLVSTESFANAMSVCSGVEV